MKKITLEICCGSVDDCVEAWKNGADRVELNSCLFLGGLTPTIGALRTCKRLTDLPVMAMVRPRGGGFDYTEAEYATALEDAELLLENGADGLVFGFLNADGSIDEERTARLVALAGERETVFHRAIDVTRDWRRSLDTLIGLGVKRVLTSGLRSDVFFALDTIAEMIDYAGGAIEILPGAGITLENAGRVAAMTGCTQMHLACHRKAADTSTRLNPAIYYGGALYPREDLYDVTDGAYVSAVRAALDAI